jgi:hypothetical protein
MARALSVISARDLGCGRAPGKLAQLARSGGDPQLLGFTETLLTIAADPKHFGARIGITSVLHIWGSALTYHMGI